MRVNKFHLAHEDATGVWLDGAFSLRALCFTQDQFLDSQGQFLDSPI